MILPIYAYGQPVLKKKAKPIDKGYPDLNVLIEDMFDSMKNAHGVGLAAPQIGKDIRLFIIDTEQLLKEGETPKIPTEGVKQTFINAQLIENLGDTWSYEEGCLSIPGVNGEVERTAGVKIKYYDQDWNAHERIFEGMEARVILHEYDHIEGVLFTEYFSALKKRLTRRKLDKIRKGKIKEIYPMIFHDYR